MLRGLQNWLHKRANTIEENVLRDMHRVASSWAGKELPDAPRDFQAGMSRKTDLNFSLRSRKRLSWMGYVIRNGH